MTQEQKTKLASYLYLNKELQEFLCNDFFQELKKELPKESCISEDNLNDEYREENLAMATMTVFIFLHNNRNYADIIKQNFTSYTDSQLLHHLVLGYVFYLTNVDENMDMFKDKRSICYTDAPPLYDFV